jgi:hypothetical protein
MNRENDNIDAGKTASNPQDSTELQDSSALPEAPLPPGSVWRRDILDLAIIKGSWRITNIERESGDI